MKMQYIYDMYNIMDFLGDFIQDKLFDFKLLKQHILDYDEKRYTVEITNDEDDFFDFYCGNMGFTIYRNDDGTAKLCENASYYIFDSDGDHIDTIDIEL